MAAPNMLATTIVYGKTAYLTPAVNTNVVLLSNAPTSGQVLKINSILVSNADGTNAINATISLYTNGTVAQNVAPTGGTAYPIITAVSIPTNASLIVVDRTASIYLEENMSIVITSAAPNKLTFIAGYESVS